MHSQDDLLARPSDSPTDRSSQLDRNLAWLAASAILCAALAILAFYAQSHGVAPVVIAPVLVGSLAGAGVFQLACWLVPNRSRRSLAAVALLCGLATPLGEDLAGYLEASAADPAPKFARAELGDPNANPSAYIIHQFTQAPLAWSLDLALTTASAAGVAYTLAGRRHTPSPQE